MEQEPMGPAAGGQPTPEQPTTEQPPTGPGPIEPPSNPGPEWAARSDASVPERPVHHGRRALIAVGTLAAAVATGLGIAAATGGGATLIVSGHGSGPSTGTSAAPVTDTMTRQATAAEQVGVVDINTVLKYQGGEAAGTGMILSSSGEVLTNNHVIDGATSIKVTVVSTGATYTASVVGTDPTDDVAVLQLQGASGLQTARLGDSSDVAVGDAVTAVGNAGGTGGTPSAASGTVTALNQSLTASDQNGANAETLTGMIEMNAAVQPGDSGGPLYDTSGEVVGMDTAASSSPSYGYDSNGYPQQQTIAYAIPIDKALSIASQIESGKETSTIHIGLPAFLGVGLQDGFNGVVVTGVAEQTPAAQAGLQAGDVITSVGGTKITSANDVTSVLDGHNPGDRISISWIDGTGQSQTATVTLATGPAD